MTTAPGYMVFGQCVVIYSYKDTVSDPLLQAIKLHIPMDGCLGTWFFVLLSCLLLIIALSKEI